MARTSVDRRERVVIHSLVTGKAVLLPLPPDAQVDWFDWAGEDRVLVSLGWTKSIDGEETYVTRLVVFDLATRTSKVLGDKYGGVEGDDVLYVDPAGQWLLLSMQESRDEYPTVFRYDLATGERTEVVKPQGRCLGVVCRLRRRRPCGPRLPGQIVVHAVSQERQRDRSVNSPRQLRRRFRRPHAARSRQRLGRRLPAVGRRRPGAMRCTGTTTRRSNSASVVYEHPINDIDDYVLSRDGKRVMSVCLTDDRDRVRLARSGDARAPGRARSARFPGMSVLFVSRDVRSASASSSGWAAPTTRARITCSSPGADSLQRLARINGAARSGAARGDRVHALQGA